MEAGADIAVQKGHTATPGLERPSEDLDTLANDLVFEGFNFHTSDDRVGREFFELDKWDQIHGQSLSDSELIRSTSQRLEQEVDDDSSSDSEFWEPEKTDSNANNAVKPSPLKLKVSFADEVSGPFGSNLSLGSDLFERELMRPGNDSIQRESEVHTDRLPEAIRTREKHYMQDGVDIPCLRVETYKKADSLAKLPRLPSEIFTPKSNLLNALTDYFSETPSGPLSPGRSQSRGFPAPATDRSYYGHDLSNANASSYFVRDDFVRSSRVAPTTTRNIGAAPSKATGFESTLQPRNGPANKLKGQRKSRGDRQQHNRGGWRTPPPHHQQGPSSQHQLDPSASGKPALKLNRKLEAVINYGQHMSVSRQQPSALKPSERQVPSRDSQAGPDRKREAIVLPEKGTGVFVPAMTASTAAKALDRRKEARFQPAKSKTPDTTGSKTTKRRQVKEQDRH